VPEIIKVLLGDSSPLQCKFQIQCHPFEKWDEKHINETVMVCILLHNMMVQAHVDSDSDPFESFCGSMIQMQMNIVTINKMELLVIMTMTMVVLMMILHNMYAVLRQKSIIKHKS